MSNVRLVSITPSVEETITYCARVSNPKNQDNMDTAPKLLKYCLDNGHHSIFEMGNMIVEIETSISIATQILRHRSFCFQQFSARYSNINELDDNVIIHEARRQDVKNRQNSIDDLDQKTKDWFHNVQTHIRDTSLEFYNNAIDKGIAKEQARFLLLQGTKTRMYMNGNIRSWIHYINLRCGNGTQLEHQEIANNIKEIFISELPSVSDALGWEL